MVKCDSTLLKNKHLNIQSVRKGLGMNSEQFDRCTSAKDNELVADVYENLDQKCKVDPDFENFEQRVQEIGSIVKGLCSKDEHVAKKAECKADLYLMESKEFDENEVYVKKDRTVINKKAFEDDDKKEQSPDAFMRMMEKDAKQRYEDKQHRKEIAEKYKKAANEAYFKEDYTKAIDLYTKALEQIKDSAILYINRAVAYLKLGLYKKMLPDCKWALELSENSLRGWLLKARALHELDEEEESRKCINEAKKRNPGQEKAIEEYIRSWNSESEEEV